MPGDHAVNAGRAVVGGDVHFAQCAELVEHEQVGLGACTQQELRQHALLLEHLAQHDQGCHAHATAHEQHGAVAMQGEAMA